MKPAYRPFLTGSNPLPMGIKTLDAVDWLEFGDDFDGQMAVRRRLLDRQPQDAVAGLPGSEPGQRELLATLLRYLSEHAADRYSISADGIEDRRSQAIFQETSEPYAPLMLAGRLVQEDFCLLQQRSGAYCLVAAVLCFPAHWRLHDKLGHPLIDIHAPVPGFADQLGDPVDRLFERLHVDRPVQRLNWSFVDTADLYLPPSHRTAPIDIAADKAGEQLWLRVERQTLRRLTDSGDVVFGIRTHLTRLDDVIDSRATADALIAKLEAMPEALAVYKNMSRVRKPLIAYLKQARGTR